MTRTIVSEREITKILREYFGCSNGELQHIDGSNGDFVEFVWREES